MTNHLVIKKMGSALSGAASIWIAIGQKQNTILITISASATNLWHRHAEMKRMNTNGSVLLKTRSTQSSHR
ncbi:MAG TPA: hypothetical protein VMT34_18420, partial [Aggregatilineales bacterium]|nr:hypothetical protein [Aggregatilineales bacterium]